MYVMARTDYSSLLGSLFSSSSSSSSNSYVSSISSLISDYNSIKNGSYGKVVSAYYAKYGNSASTNSTSTTSSSSTSTTTSAALKSLSTISTDAQALQTSATDLTASSLYDKKNVTTTDSDGNSSTSYDYDYATLYSDVSKFVDNYNSLLSESSSSSTSTIATRSSFLKTVTNLNKDALSAVGISVDSDTNKLSIDKNTFKSADISDIKSLFGNSSGYGSKVSSAASLIESAADVATSALGSTSY